MNTKIMVL